MSVSCGGPWQWPYRGICVGEASHPGPPGGMYAYADEDQHMDDMLQDSITMASQVVEILDAREEEADNDVATLPGTGGSINATLYVGPSFEFAPSANEGPLNEDRAPGSPDSDFEMVGVRGGQSDLDDTESRGGESEYDGEGSVPRDSGHSQPIPIAVPRGMSTTVFKVAFPLLDAVDLEMEFRHRAHVFKSVPWIMKGPVRTAYRFALSTILEATQTRDVELETRAFKPFL